MHMHTCAHTLTYTNTFTQIIVLLCSTFLLYSYTAVSYTHLDVYKRQVCVHARVVCMLVYVKELRHFVLHHQMFSLYTTRKL